MQIAQLRVMLACRSMDEAYEFRRGQADGSKPGAHLELAEWCLRYNLLDDAGRELAEARKLDPDHPRLALLERRLAKINTPTRTKTSIQPVAKSRPQTENAPPQTPSVSSDLPEGVVELFTRKVQPVLVNSCTTSGCHQSGGQQTFQLDRAILRGESNRRSTMHNLEAALALVDRDHPDQSRLLTIPRKTHGGMAAPIFGPRQEQAYKHLVDWIALIVPPVELPAPIANEWANPADAATATATAENGKPSPIALPIRGNAKTEGVSTADKSSAAVPVPNALPVTSHRQSPVRGTAATDDEAPRTLRTPHRLQYGALLQSWQPRDAFDPEIFNRGQRAQAHADSAEARPNTAPAAAAAADNR